MNQKALIAIWFRFARLPFVLYRIVSGLLCLFLALGVFIFGAERRKVLFTNLALCFPNVSRLQRWIWAGQHIYLYLRTFLDRGWLWAGDAGLVRERVHIENPQALRRLQLGGKPTIFLAPHFLGLDAAWSRLSLDINMVTMYSNQKNEQLNQVMLEGRKKYGNQKLLSRQEGVRSLVKAMKKGCPLYYLPDMDFGERDSVFVKFFGVQAATVTAVSRLSRLLDAQVVPVLTRFDKGTYRVSVLEPIEPFPLGSDTESTQKVNSCIEKWVQVNVPQYLWTHKRFKTRPEGESKYY